MTVASVLGRDFDRRRATYAAGAFAVLGLMAALVVSIGSGQFVVAGALAGLAALPLLIVAAIRWPYVFPYGLYAVLVPFDDVLAIPGAGTILRYLGVVAALAIGLTIVTRRRVSAPSASLKLWLAFLAWLIFSILWSPDTTEAFLNLQSMGLLVVLFAALALAPATEEDVRFVCAATILGGVIAGACGMYVLRTVPQVLGDGGRVFITFGGRTLDPNGFADSLLVPFALALVALTRARTPRTLFLTGTALLLICGGLLAAVSRDAFLAAAAVVAITAWFSRRRLLALAVTIPVLAISPLIFPAIADRMSDALSTGGAGRTSIWSVDWKAFLQHPIFGWGAGGSIDAYNANYLSVFESYNTGWSRPAHNTVLTVCVEFGIIGFVLFYSAWLSGFRPLAAIDRMSSLYDLRVGVTSGLVAFLVCGLFIDVLSHKDFWLVLGLAAQLRTVVRGRQQAAAMLASAATYEIAAAPAAARAARGRWRPRPS